MNHRTSGVTMNRHRKPSPAITKELERAIEKPSSAEAACHGQASLR